MAASSAEFPRKTLAEVTSLATPSMFAFVNRLMLRIPTKPTRSDTVVVRVPPWIPVPELATCLLIRGPALSRHGETDGKERSS